MITNLRMDLCFKPKSPGVWRCRACRSGRRGDSSPCPPPAPAPGPCRPPPGSGAEQPPVLVSISDDVIYGRTPLRSSPMAAMVSTRPHVESMVTMTSAQCQCPPRPAVRRGLMGPSQGSARHSSDRHPYRGSKWGCSGF